MKPDILIDCINRSCKKSVHNSFNLSLSNSDCTLRRYVIDGTSYAVNRFDIPQESVKVWNWLNDFWLFIEIKFSLKRENENEERKKGTKRQEIKIDTRISLSVFQGEDNDDEKHQLFRAEWDDYNNFNEQHAQPHWHITSNQAMENTFCKYADTFDRQDFLQLLENEKQNMFDVRKIHFAMNGDWYNNKTHIHRLEDEQQVAIWLQGLLAHLRTELEPR
jgi:hypothetical protein